ncbi:MAG: hypothetical protein AAFX87_25940 [Bacteroidota bacterium]
MEKSFQAKEEQNSNTSIVQSPFDAATAQIDALFKAPWEDHFQAIDPFSAAQADPVLKPGTYTVKNANAEGINLFYQPNIANHDHFIPNGTMVQVLSYNHPQRQWLKIRYESQNKIKEGYVKASLAPYLKTDLADVPETLSEEVVVTHSTQLDRLEELRSGDEDGFFSFLVDIESESKAVNLLRALTPTEQRLFLQNEKLSNYYRHELSMSEITQAVATWNISLDEKLTYLLPAIKKYNYKEEVKKEDLLSAANTYQALRQPRVYKYKRTEEFRELLAYHSLQGSDINPELVNKKDTLYDDFQHPDREFQITTTDLENIDQLSSSQHKDEQTKEAFYSFFLKNAAVEANAMMDFSQKELNKYLKVYARGGFDQLKADFIQVMEEASTSGLTYVQRFNRRMNDIHTEKSAYDTNVSEIQDILAKKHPVLMAIGDFPKFYRLLKKKDDDKVRSYLEEVISDKLDNIRESRENLRDDPELIWLLPKLVQITKLDLQGSAKLGIGKSELFAIIDKKAAAEQDYKNTVDIVLGSISLALGLAGALTTGGWSLALTAGSLVSGGVEAYRAYQDYQFFHPASDTSLSSVYAISENDPSWIWAAMAILGVGIDAVTALKIVKALKIKGVQIKTAADIEAATEEVVTVIRQHRKVESAEELTKIQQRVRKEARRKLEYDQLNERLATAKGEFQAYSRGLVYSNPFADPQFVELFTRYASLAIEKGVKDFARFLKELPEDVRKLVSKNQAEGEKRFGKLVEKGGAKSEENLIQTKDYSQGGETKVARVGGSEIAHSFRSRLTSKIEANPKFSLKYTDTEIQSIVKKGRELGLKDEVIDDLLFVGSRDAKRLQADELLQQMDNYVNVVSQRGFPYKFKSVEEFEAFKNDLKLGLNNLKIPTSDVRIQGSSLRTPKANDVDLVAILKQEEFDNLVKTKFRANISKNGVNIDISKMTTQELKNLANDIGLNRSSYNRKAFEDFKYTIDNQIINAKGSKNIVKNFKTLRNDLIKKYPDLKIDNISIQPVNSGFDLNPFMKL